MTKPDWNERQHPEQRSKEHGKRDHVHGPDEHGLGALREPGRQPKQDPQDLTILAPDEGAAPTVSYASSFYIGSAPPVTDQGSTPRCTSYSQAYDQNQHDRPDNLSNSFKNFDEPGFHYSIGGTATVGTYPSRALARRRDYGYPEAVNVSGQDSNPSPSAHRIASWADVERTVTAIKDALLLGHGVLLTGDWFHSWFHPFSSGKLPAPDYRVGGHAIWCRGWNDSYGFRLRNSWGTGWGLSGDCFLPYAHLARFYEAFRTTDK
jgi:C1A family cysteine protease